METTFSIAAPKQERLRPSFAPRRPFIGEVRDSSFEQVDALQRWLQVRFDGLQPGDFSSIAAPLAIYSATPLVAPSGFQNVWRNIDKPHSVGGTVSPEECRLLSSAKLVLVLADLNDSGQIENVCHLGRFIMRMFEEQRGPHVFLVQHSVKPASDESAQFKAFVEVSRNGIHDVIENHFASFKLASAVWNRFLQGDLRKRECQECALEASMELQSKKDELQWHIYDTFWDYLRQRLDVMLPPIDPNIAPGLAPTLGSQQVGAIVGAGTCGKVHKLLQDGQLTGEVVKILPKNRVTRLSDLKALRKQIRVLKLVSSDRARHPNIIQLIDIYHSETHIFFRLEDGGSRDLHKRLHHRDNRRSPLGGLCSRKVLSIVQQVSSALCHLHTVPDVVHLDIKPENIILSENANDIHISITDFDTAVARPMLACRGIVGTYPFIAPEVFHQDSFNPYAADVWSMATVFLELVCCVDVLEKALRLDRIVNTVPRREMTIHQKNMTDIMRTYFSQKDAVSRLLEIHLHPTLTDLMGGLELLLPSMLDVADSSRASSSQVVQAFNEILWQ
jgi:serine/threonine protein kinase|mmetsp:Transcript_121622/g.192544  ORF Transcript_121622/g.192544 Transcript_121622/m.192544 type:complete len:560 (+) Transcript_121622:54-1733(+)